jgi:hypothetical protein
VNAAADRVLAGEMHRDEALIHDRVRRRRRSVLICEPASADDRHPHRLEVAAADAEHGDLGHGQAVGLRAPLD